MAPAELSVLPSPINAPRKNPPTRESICSCTTNNSKLEVPELLDFNTLNLSVTPSKTENLKVKNAGGVPFDITYCITAGEDDFSTVLPSADGAEISTPVSLEASPLTDDCTGRMKTALVPQLGFTDLPVELAPQLSGDYIGSLHIESTAALDPTADIDLVGNGKGQLSFGFHPPTISISKMGGSAEIACNSIYTGVVFVVPTSPTSSELMYSTSINDGKTFSKPEVLFGGHDLLASPLISKALTGKGFQFVYTDESTAPPSVYSRYC